MDVYRCSIVGYKEIKSQTLVPASDNALQQRGTAIDEKGDERAAKGSG
jgi:hypothetical protein